MLVSNVGLDGLLNGLGPSYYTLKAGGQGRVAAVDVG